MTRKLDLERLRETPPEETARYLRSNRRKLRIRVHEGPAKTVRTDVYKGREIRITTTYDIRIDGRLVGGHVEVSPEGRVHYHGLPAYSWMSAVDLVRQVIDSFPDEFPERGKITRKRSTSKTQGLRKGSKSKSSSRARR